MLEIRVSDDGIPTSKELTALLAAAHCLQHNARNFVLVMIAAKKEPALKAGDLYEIF